MRKIRWVLLGLILAIAVYGCVFTWSRLEYKRYVDYEIERITREKPDWWKIDSYYEWSHGKIMINLGIGLGIFVILGAAVLLRGVNWKDLVKYFIHGVAFSLIFIVLAIVWIFGALILVILGSVIGLIIALGILMLIIGGLNVFLTSLLWFPVKSSFWSIVGHGILLSVVLVIVNAIFVLAPLLVFSGITTQIVTFIIGSFADGLVAKKVAGSWKKEAPEEISEVVEAKWADRNL